MPPHVDCQKPTQGDVSAYFDVPGADGTDPDGDFFRLPIPNDARITGGKIDLTGFPTPGALLLGFDPVQSYVDAVTKHESAWGAYPTVFFRFDGTIDFKTFSGTAASQIFFLDITDPKEPGNGGAQWTYSIGRGLYVCDNWFAVRRPRGAPLEPGHTYTVYLTMGGTGSNGNKVARPAQFAAMLGATTPADKGLTHAWDTFAPLRAYLTEQAKLGTEGIKADQLLVGTVFTVADTRAPMAALAAAATKAPAPEATQWTKCGGTAKSPCPQADGDRACGESTKDYDEYHALVSVPVYQQGIEPYLKSGGDIDPTKPRTEEVCAALTVPKGTMPAAGFPIAVFAHGTGGSFRDHVRDEVAGALARSTPPVAVLGYDQVMHGPRRGASLDSPNNLFFNFKNPDVARGNPMQGGADVITMGRLAGAITLPATLTGGAALKTDKAHVVFFGHSQGSMHGSLGLPYTNDYSAAVLSGNGASLMHALLSKTAPENIAQAVPFALGGDYDNKKRLFGGESHPVLSLLQQWIDPADPLNFAQAIAKTPEKDILPKSVFQTYGLADTYSPPVTLQTYVLAAQMSLATHDPSVTTPDDIGGLEEQKTPLAGNLTVNTHTVTLAAREYANATDDGHFVVFDVPSANEDAIRFLSMAAAGKVPQVGK